MKMCEFFFHILMKNTEFLSLYIEKKMDENNFDNEKREGLRN